MDISPLTFFLILLVVGLVLRSVFGPEHAGYTLDWSGQKHSWSIDRVLSADGAVQLHRFMSKQMPATYLIDLELKTSPEARFNSVSASMTVAQARQLQRELDKILDGKQV